MRRALELASSGLAEVSPNPMVGCVVVHQDFIIGEGYHKVYGGPHAEPNAISNVEDQSLLEDATVYVTLEPCAHWGKTGPCAKLLIDKKVSKVVVGAIDSNPLVGGKGIQMLKDAGIEVVFGVMEKEVRFQNRRFFTRIEKKRPYIILKWAQTLDGFIARENFDSKWISNVYSRQLVHRWRSEEDAIMVGTNTAFYDDPKLNVREWVGKNPIRVVLDRNMRLKNDLFLFDQNQQTICYNQKLSEQNNLLDYVKLDIGFDIEDVVEDLFRRKIQSIIIEGGSALLKNFIKKELWDEARVFAGRQMFQKGIPAPAVSGQLWQETDVMGDRLQIIGR